MLPISHILLEHQQFSNITTVGYNWKSYKEQIQKTKTREEFKGSGTYSSKKTQCIVFYPYQYNLHTKVLFTWVPITNTCWVSKKKKKKGNYKQSQETKQSPELNWDLIQMLKL